MQEFLYIVDSANYNGNIIDTMDLVPQDRINAEILHYGGGKTFEQYNKYHNGTLVALNWDDYYSMYLSQYLKSKQKPFAETTEDMYCNALEAVPPKRFTRDGKNEFFFLGECETFNLYSCYVKKVDKYYSALRSIETPTEHLFNLEDVK